VSNFKARVQIFIWKPIVSYYPQLLQVNNLSKSFGPVEALAGVNFELKPGDVLGVVGQRGSGKSTLFSLLSGVYTPSSGEIYLMGKHVVFKSASQAQKAGIDTVHQNPVLADNLGVLGNVFLGREICLETHFKIWPKDGEMAIIARQFFGDFDLPPDFIQKNTGSLSTEHRRIISLARVFWRPNKILLLDDALADLNFSRQQTLLNKIKEISAQNMAVVISSDDLKQIFAVTNRILVLYEGRQVAIKLTSETTPREIVELIVGSNRRDRVTPVIWAFENYYGAQQQAEELRRSQQVLRQSLQEQDSLNRQLFERLRDQMDALDKLNMALQDANRRLITERETERKYLARELHDQVIQDLLSYNYQLEEAETEMTDEALRQGVNEIRGGIRQVVSNLREMCSDLRPPTIDGHGLSAAIRSLAYQWSKQSGIQVELEIDPGLGRMPETIELSVFRIIQEGLSNVRKHAYASLVKLRLYRTATASLVVHMQDNGHGMTTPIDLAELSVEKHFGLVGVSERVSLLGGTMQVESPASGGLGLIIEIPSPYPIFTG
jgi:signal transduction histidine kinase